MIRERVGKSALAGLGVVLLLALWPGNIWFFGRHYTLKIVDCLSEGPILAGHAIFSSIDRSTLLKLLLGRGQNSEGGNRDGHFDLGSSRSVVVGGELALRPPHGSVWRSESLRLAERSLELDL